MADELKKLKRSTPAEARRGKTEVGWAVIQGEVVLKFPQPMEVLTFGSENARAFAEIMGRCAYEAHYGKPPPDDMASVIAQDIRDKLTDQLRDRMIARIALVMPSMLEQLKGQKTPGRIAMELVDIFMREVTL